MFSKNKKKNITLSQINEYGRQNSPYISIDPGFFFYGGNLATWQVNILARSSSILLATYGNFHWSQKYVILFWI